MLHNNHSSLRECSFTRHWWSHDWEIVLSERSPNWVTFLVELFTNQNVFIMIIKMWNTYTPPLDGCHSLWYLMDSIKIATELSLIRFVRIIRWRWDCRDILILIIAKLMEKALYASGLVFLGCQFGTRAIHFFIAFLELVQPSFSVDKVITIKGTYHFLSTIKNILVQVFWPMLLKMHYLLFQVEHNLWFRIVGVSRC